MIYHKIFEKIDMSTTNAYVSMLLNKCSKSIIQAKDQSNNPHEVCNNICEILDQQFGTDFQIYFTIGTEDIPESYVATGEIDHYGNITIFLDAMSIFNGFPNLDENPIEYFKSLKMTITHELMHLDQINRSDFNLKGKNEADYESKHEIQAHAKDAIDIMFQYRNIETSEDIINWIKQMIRDNDWREISPIWGYWESFGEYKDDPESQKIWKRFLSYLYYYAINS